MEKIIIEGGAKLSGTIHVSGAKNAVLPLIAAALLTDGVCEITEAPWLTDVKYMCEVLEHLGCEAHYENSTLYINTHGLSGTTPPYEQVRKMRASTLVMGPLLARMGKVTISLPGGCNIGARPIDLHLKGFEAMGAKITIDNNGVCDVITAEAEKLHGARIYLNYPSVGATENLMMAAALAEGVTTLENVAQEPEIVDLSNFLNAMGAQIKGAGTNVIRITGVEKLHGATVCAHDLRAGAALVIAGLAAEGVTYVEHIHFIERGYEHLIRKLSELGADIRKIEE